MTNSFINAFIQTLPPAHVNNSREIVRRLWSKWQSSRSSYFAYKLSLLLGREADLKDIHGTYTEYPRTEGPNDYSEFYDGTHEKLADNIPF